MHTPILFKKWLLIGILIEVVIFGSCYFYFEDLNEVFRYAARYSGRVAWICYLGMFYFFAKTYHKQDEIILQNLKKIITVFCVMHFIHLGFLATNIYLNNIELVPFKLAGGGLAYLFILIYPFFIHKLKSNVPRLVYFYYLGVIVAATYLVRIKGDFEGVVPSPIHYIGLVSTLLAFVIFSIMIFSKRSH